MRRSKTLSLAATALFLIVFALYFALNTEKFHPLLHINGYLLVLIAIGDITGIFFEWHFYQIYS